MTELEVNPQVVPSLDLVLAAEVIDTLRQGGVLETTGTSLTLDPETPYESYEALGAALGLINRSCSWWIGDWLLFGEGTYGERFAQAAEATGLAEQTLLNRVTICRAIPPSRRVPGLSFSTHALVAPLGAREQRHWLKLANDNGWTRAELARQLKQRDEDDGGSDGGPSGGSGGEDQRLIVDAARVLVANYELAGENVIVRREHFARLMAAFGEED